MHARSEEFADILIADPGFFQHLNNNEIEALPESFRDLQALRELDLLANRLTSFPEPLSDLPSLLNLTLSNNLSLSQTTFHFLIFNE